MRRGRFCDRPLLIDVFAVGFQPKPFLTGGGVSQFSQSVNTSIRCPMISPSISLPMALNMRSIDACLNSPTTPHLTQTVW